MKAEKEKIEKLYLWAEQNAQGVGELFINDEDKKELLENPISTTVIFEDEEYLKVINVFLQAPFEYGFASPVGKKYEAIKDFLKWNELDVKFWTPVILYMGDVWIKNMRKA